MGLVVSLAITPRASEQVGPAAVSASVEVGTGRTEVSIPPLGTVVARTHTSPLDLRLSVDRVNFEQLGPLATSEAGRARLRDLVTTDLGQLARESAVRELIGAVIFAALIAIIVFRHRWSAVVASSVAALMLAGSAGGAIVGTYSVDPFDEPRFTGTLTSAREVIAAVRESQDVLDEARSRFEIATRRISDLIALLGEGEGGREDAGTVFLHVSDIHANPIGLEIADELAQEFEVDAIIDTGDLGSAELDTGEITTLTGPVDRALARAIARIRVPYIYVAGNHDSPTLRAFVARANNVVPLRSDATFIDGIEIFGWADPTFSTQPIPEDEKALERLAVAEEEVAPAVVAASPDVVAVHAERLASFSFGDVPVVLAGHSHERAVRVEEDTLILTVGSTGATGLKSLAVEGDRPYEAQVLYFEGDTLTALDYISLRGLGSEFVLERTTFTD